MKGVLKSFEAVIAILAVITVYLVLFGSGEKIPDIEVVTWRTRGFEALKAIDEKNKLATLALANDTSSIESELASLLPLGLDYDVVVCSQSCPSVGISSEKISSANYFVVGNTTNIDPKEVVVYIWRGT